MQQFYAEIIDFMERVFRDFEAGFGDVENVEVGDEYVARPVRKDLYTAVLLKLAFIASSLRAALAVNEAGYYMQQALLCRAIDEANEDVVFLVIGETAATRNELHDKFLEAFWAEEFEDLLDPVGTHRSRPMVSRKKIQAFLARAEGNDHAKGHEGAHQVLFWVRTCCCAPYHGHLRGATAALSDWIHARNAAARRVRCRPLELRVPKSSLVPRCSEALRL